MEQLDSVILHHPLGGKTETSLAATLQTGEFGNINLTDSVRSYGNRFEMEVVRPAADEIVRFRSKSANGGVQVSLFQREPETSVRRDSIYDQGVEVTVMVGNKPFKVTYTLDEFQKTIKADDVTKKREADDLRLMFADAFEAKKSDRQGQQIFVPIRERRPEYREEDGTIDLQGRMINFMGRAIEAIYSRTCYPGAVNPFNRDNNLEVMPIEMFPAATFAAFNLARYFNDQSLGGGDTEKPRDLLGRSIVAIRREIQKAMLSQLPRFRGAAGESDLLGSAVLENYESAKTDLLPNPRNLLFVERVLVNSVASADGVEYYSFQQAAHLIARYTNALRNFANKPAIPAEPGSEPFTNELGGLIDDESYRFLMDLRRQGLDTYSERYFKMVSSRSAGYDPSMQLPNPSGLDLIYEAVVSAQKGRPASSYRENSDATESDLARLYRYMLSSKERGERQWRTTSGSANLGAKTATLEIIQQMEDASRLRAEKANWLQMRDGCIDDFITTLQQVLPQNLVAGTIIKLAQEADPEVMFDLDDDMVNVLRILLTPDSDLSELGRAGVEMGTITMIRKLLTWHQEQYVKFAMASVQELVGKYKASRAEQNGN